MSESRIIHPPEVRVNEVRSLLAAASSPDVISVAGGLPDKNLFPMQELQEIEAEVRAHPEWYQYGRTQGLEVYRESLVPFLRETAGVEATPAEIMAGTGSQQFIYLLGQHFLRNPGDMVAVDGPTYLGALGAFDQFRPNYLQLISDEQGIIPESLKMAFEEHPELKFIYLNPTFSNPSGTTLPMERRVAIAEILQEHNGLLAEDDPYGLLRQEGKPVPSIKSIAPDNVVYLGTGSKIFMPGKRVAWAVPPTSYRGEDLKTALIKAKESIDLMSPPDAQAEFALFLKRGLLPPHINTVNEAYAQRRTIMLEAIQRYFPSDFKAVKPEGGLFIWVQADGRDIYDVRPVAQRAIKRNVAFVTGSAFYANPEEGKASMRLNFSGEADPAKIEYAMQVIGEELQVQT